MAQDAIPVSSLLAQKLALEAELDGMKVKIESMERRRDHIRIELDLLNRLMHGIPHPVAATKMGPTDAVRKVLSQDPGLTRKEIIERALTMVSTDPSKARKTLDQTIRNLMNKEIKKNDQGRLTLLGSTNGHLD